MLCGFYYTRNEYSLTTGRGESRGGRGHIMGMLMPCTVYGGVECSRGRRVAPSGVHPPAADVSGSNTYMHAGRCTLVHVDAAAAVGRCRVRTEIGE